MRSGQGLIIRMGRRRSYRKGCKFYLFSIEAFSFSSHALARDILFSVSTRARAASERIENLDLRVSFSPSKMDYDLNLPLSLESETFSSEAEEKRKEIR